MKKKIHLKKKKKIKKLWFLIPIIFIILIFIASKKISKTAQVYASSEIKKIITNKITETISQVKVEENIFVVEKNNDEISSINVDNAALNSIIGIINKNIQDKLDSMENTIVFKMPLLSPTNNIFLSNIGPTIPIKYKTIGNIINNLRTEVKNYGINNAVIVTYADIKIDCSVILPITIEDIEIVQTITLATKIIQGKIPSYYFGKNN